MRNTITTAGAVLLLALTQHAVAAPIEYSFVASSFSGYRSTPSPENTISGSYTIDSGALTQFETSIGATLFSLTDVGFIYTNPSVYSMGGLLNGSKSVGTGTTDFYLGVNLSGKSTFYYSKSGFQDVWTAGQVTISSASSAVPLPSSLPLLASGIAGALFTRRKRSVV